MTTHVKTSLTVIQIVRMTRTEKEALIDQIDEEFQNAPEFFYKTRRADELRELYETVLRYL